MKLFRITAAFFFCALLPAAAAPQEKELSITIDQAVDYAVRGNLSIRKSGIVLDAAKDSRDTSWSSVSPSISASASWSKSDKDSTGTVSLSGNATFTLQPSLYTSIKAAVIDYEQARISYDQTVRTVELNVRTAFWNMLNLKESISLQEASVNTSKSQYESNLAKYNRGALSRLDVLTAQVAYQQAQLTLDQKKSSWDTGMAQFKQMLGLDQNTVLHLEGSFDEILSLKPITYESLTIDSDSIAILKKKIESARNAVLANRLNAYAPSFNASYVYRASAADDDLGSLSSNTGSTVTVGVTLPLDGVLPWSSRAQAIEAKKDTLSSLELELEDAQTSLEVSINSYLAQIKQAQDQIKLRKSSISLAQESYTMTLDAYNHGTKDLLSLQNASDSLYSSKVNLINQAYTLETAILNLENIIGVPFGTLGK